MPATQMAWRREATLVHQTQQDAGVTLCMREIAPVDGLAGGRISVRLATEECERALAMDLLNRMYSWRGYGADHRLSGGEHCATFTANLGDDVVGTLTLGVDSPARLAADTTFKEELDAFRASPNVRICELTKFAFNSNVRSRQALATLFHTIFTFEARCFSCTDVFIEVHPRHVHFYEVMLGFRRVGAPKIDSAVTWWPSNVPVQLMRLNLGDMRCYIDEQRAQSEQFKRSLYPFFLPKHEEHAVASRIAALFGHIAAAA